MDEQNVPGLPADWQPPELVTQQKAWADLPAERREYLMSLQREHGWREGRRLDVIAGEPADAAWVELVLFPPDPRDGEPERIGRWPAKLEHDEYARVNAIIDEHFPAQ